MTSIASRVGAVAASLATAAAIAAVALFSGHADVPGATEVGYGVWRKTDAKGCLIETRDGGQTWTPWIDYGGLSAHEDTMACRSPSLAN